MLPEELEPPNLTLLRRDRRDWRDLAAGESAPVAVWHLADPDDAWVGGTFSPPTPGPQAWADVLAGDLAEELVRWRAHRDGLR